MLEINSRGAYLCEMDAYDGYGMFLQGLEPRDGRNDDDTDDEYMGDEDGVHRDLGMSAGRRWRKEGSRRGG